MPFARDPAQLVERYGRQLLVLGADFDGQQRLHHLAAVFGADASPVAQAAAEVAARYLVGAGLGRAVAPSAWSAGLVEQDRALRLLDDPALADPPVAQFWFAVRPYGASVDVALTDAGPGWQAGATGPARVATLRLDLGAPAEAGDAVTLGALAADLIVQDALALEPLPALVNVDWRDPTAPAVAKVPRATEGSGPTAPAWAPGLLAEWRGSPEAVAVVVAECQARYPLEACGLLLRDAGGALIATAAPNLQDRYHAIDPAAYPRTARTAYKLNERLIAKAADAGQTLVGIWHSHCDAGAYFSGEDVRCAAPNDQPLYPGVAYLVCSVVGGRLAGIRMYHWDEVRLAFAAELDATTAAPVQEQSQD